MDLRVKPEDDGRKLVNSLLTPTDKVPRSLLVNM